MEATFDSMADQLATITKGTQAWGLAWTILSLLSWTIWGQNQPVKRGIFYTKESILRQVIVHHNQDEDAAVNLG